VGGGAAAGGAGGEGGTPGTAGGGARGAAGGEGGPGGRRGLPRRTPLGRHAAVAAGLRGEAAGVAVPVDDGAVAARPVAPAGIRRGRLPRQRGSGGARPRGRGRRCSRSAPRGEAAGV